MIYRTLCAIAAIVLAGAARADETAFISGNTLYQRMTSESSADRSNAMGYVTGIADFADGATFCVPRDVNVRQMTDVAKQYMATRPALRHISGAVLVTAALMDAFPCPNAKKTPGAM